MADSDQNSQIVNDPNSPNEPLPPGDGDGGGNGHPPPVRITSIAPIAGNLAGGSDVTIDGFGFQPAAEVFFGTTAATDVQVQSSTQVIAKAPAGTQTGTVPISIVNPDGSTAQLANGFTYFTGDPSNLAEVLGVEPPNIIEDSDTQVTVRGRNLIAAHENGLFAFRGPARAAISVSDFSSSRDEATGVETLASMVRVVANPPLAAEERMAIQVLASVRPEAQTDGIAESSKEMFVVLPRSMPVTLAYTKSVDPARPNLVIVTGRNLEGCSLDLGASATIHAQRSEDEYVAVLVSYPGDQLAPQLAVRSDGGGEVARLEMSVTAADDTQAAATTKEGAQPDLAIEPGGDPGDGGGGDGIPGLTPVPGQQVVGPTAQSSTVVTLGGQVLDSFSFDWSSFAVSLFRITFRLRIANFIKVVAFFDGGGEDLNSPVLAKVGHLMPLRGMGILVALRVEIIVSIRLLIIVSWKHGFDFSPWGSDPGFGLGSLVIGFELDIDIDINIFFMVALVLPNGSLKVLALEDFDLNFHFQLDANGLQLTFNKHKHEVRPRRIGPLLGLPFLCEDRFQLADDNGQTSFTDAAGGTLAFYFVRGPGRCCLRWNFDLDLIRFTDDGSETIIQPPFDADFCLNALDSSNQNIPIVVSDQCPNGVLGLPNEEQLTIGENEDHLRALIRPVDPESGNFLPDPGELEDVTEAGYTPYFYLQDPTREVLEPHVLFTGKAIPTQPGRNVICVQLSKNTVEVIPGVEAPSFWPGAVTGFSILSFLARGLAPALLFKCEGEGQAEDSVGLPVVVDPLAANKITVTPTIVYRDPANSANLIEAKGVLLRNEPFEAQREYFLVAKVIMGSTAPAQNLKFKIKTAKLDRAPLTQVPNASFNRGRTRADAKLFFKGKLANEQQETTLSVSPADSGHTLEVPQFTITPNNFEEGPDTGNVTAMVMPGHDVANRDVKLTVELEVTSDNGSTTISVNNKKFDLTVSNGENFEEYLRVFQEPQKLLQSSGLKDFASQFATQLAALGTANLNSFLETQGKSLWTKALAEIKNKKDDRPLYWTRLRCIAALKAYYAAKKLGQPSTDTIQQFEYPSRGLSTTGKLELEASTKAIFTGFDPFALPSEGAGRSNPSGIAALDLNGQNLGTSGVEVHLQSVIFPVRYDDFDHKIVENAISPILSSVVMVMSCSENLGRDFYDVERWAGRRRAAGAGDNNAKALSGSGVVEPKDLQDKEFLESTLPYELVITTATDTLSGPQGATPFVIDQSYRKAGGTTASPASFASPELADNAKARVNWCTKLIQDLSTNNSIEGSGSNFLSNEIFYRIAHVRAQSGVATGHFHVPSTGSDPGSTAGPLVSGVIEAVKRMLIAVTGSRLTNVLPPDTFGLTFQKTLVGQTRSLMLTARNDSNETIQVVSADVAPPFHLTLPATLPIAVPPNGTISLNLTFAPSAVDKFDAAVRAKNTDDRFVLACSLHGEAVNTLPPPEIKDFDPKSGELGDSTTITGLNFTGVTAVRIGTTSGQGVVFNFVSDTEIEATVDSNARTGKIEVETPSGKARSTVNFTVRKKRPPSPEDLGAQLEARREELNLTPAQAAAQIGAQPGTYRRWEQGKDKPSARYHAAIVSFLGHDPDRDPREFGQQIKAARERDGLTRTQLARQLGIAPSTVKSWEDGNVSRPNPRVEEIFEGYLKEE
jgi:DNA-binding transcriptional regulator YiaG